MNVKDQLNRELIIPKTPKRIISLVPSLTELLVDLGLEENIVGITKFCIYPKYLLKTKIIVGGTKQIHINKIKNLKPDFILCNKEENTKDIIHQIEKIAPTYISDINTIEDILKLINDLGFILNCQEKATFLNRKIELKRSDFLKFVKNKTVKKVAYFIWKNPYMVVGENTFINKMLVLNNFENVYIGESRYPEIDINKLKETDYILLSSEPYPFKEKHIKEFKKYTNAKVIIVNGEFFSWYGSRLVESFKYFQKLNAKLQYGPNFL